LVAQSEDEELKAHFASLAETLASNEQKIIAELNNAQGPAVELGGYYKPDAQAVSKIMRPSETFNQALSEIQ